MAALTASGFSSGRHVAGIGDFDELGAADRLGHPLHLGERA